MKEQNSTTNPLLSKSVFKSFLSLFFSIFLLLSIVVPPHAFATSITISNPHVTKLHSYKGQLHDHTTNSDGSQSPWDVVTAYKNAGYNFISITDHNLITLDPGVGGILFIPGVEQSCIGGHIGWINAKSSETNTSIPAQTLINKINDEGGIAILNHPHYPKPNGTWIPAKIDAISGYAGIEIYNSLLLTDGTARAEDRWDYVLSQNKKVWGFATDDCHNQNSSRCRTAYVQVFANNLTADEIVNNIKSGNFYSGYTPQGSTDIILTVSTSGNTITAATNVAATIEFIASGGVVKKTESNKTSSSYTPVAVDKYVRIRVTKDESKAWSNPLFITQANPTPTHTPTPTPTRTPTPTPNPNCTCENDVCSSTACAFEKFSDVTYAPLIKCYLSSSLFATVPSTVNKTSWCKATKRTKGDADGNGAVNNSDYFYYVAAVNGGKIPVTVNPDFNGDGEVGSSDRIIIIKSL